MDQLVTLQSLRDQIRFRADMVDDPHVQDTDLTTLVNARAKRLYAKLTSKAPADYAKYSGALTITTDTSIPASSVAVPTDFFKLVRCDASGDSGGSWVRLRRFADQEEPGLQLASGLPAWAALMRYQLRAGVNAIYFVPVPPPTALVRLLYIPRLAALANPTDTLDGVNGWEEWLVLDCAILLLGREESDASALIRERDQLGADLEAEMDNRDTDEPMRVVDVRGRRS